MTIPEVTVVRSSGPSQRVRRVLVDGIEIRVSAVSVRRSADDLARVTLEIPAVYRELEEDE